jgi:hypothetical protein
MYSNRRFFCSFFFSLVVLSGSLSATLNFKQEVTLTSFMSEEDSKDIVKQFLRAADGDLDLKVVDVRYKLEQWGKDCIAYNAIITCHVSKPDKDVFACPRKDDSK